MGTQRYATCTTMNKFIPNFVDQPYIDQPNEFTVGIIEYDLFNLLLSPEQAYKLLNNKLHFNKHNKNYIDEKNKKLTPEGVAYFNQVLNESVDFYERVFHEKLYTSHTRQWNKDKKGKTKLKNHDEIIKFLMYNTNTKHSAINRSNQCFLLKIMRAINDFNIHQKNFYLAEENFDYIQRNIILKKFKTTKNSYPENEENIKHLVLRSQSSRYNTIPIYFILDSRIKSKIRSIIKILGNKKYNSSSTLKDIYGLRCQVESEIDALRLLEYFWITFKGEIVHKNLFGTNIEEISKLIHEAEKNQALNPKFKDFLLKEIIENGSNKKNDKNYKDVKIIPEILDQNGEKQKIEIQITLEGNSNNSSTAHHGVLEIKALIEAEVRLRGFTHLGKVDMYINDIIERNIGECIKKGENPNILYLGGFSKEQNFAELSPEDKKKFINNTKNYIKEHIKDHFLKGYKPICLGKGNELYTIKTQ